jgi:gas vesicle protein
MPEHYANELDPSYFRSDPSTESWNQTGSTIGMFLLGAGIGFAAAVLLAPKRGAELRSQFSDVGRDSFERVRGFADDLRQRFVPERMQDQVSDVFEQARSRAEDLVSRAKRTVSSHAAGATQASSGRDISDLLNNVSKDDLVAVQGIGPVLADRIIHNRPYRGERELLDKDILSQADFDALKRGLLSKVA